MLVLGISSGLPFALIGNTLGFWLADAQRRAGRDRLRSRGSASTYTVKFVWGAMVDRIKAPLIGRLGRRRSWMLISQVVAGGGPDRHGPDRPEDPARLVRGPAPSSRRVGAATQDTAIDAWRIEIAADADELGLLTSAYSARLPRRADPHRGGDPDGRQADRLADQLRHLRRGDGRSASSPCCSPREPARGRRGDGGQERRTAERHPLPAVYDAVIGPLIAFFRTHGVGDGGADAGDDHLLPPVRLHARADEPTRTTARCSIDKDTIGWVRLVVGHARLASSASRSAASRRCGSATTAP